MWSHYDVCARKHARLAHRLLKVRRYVLFVCACICARGLCIMLSLFQRHKQHNINLSSNRMEEHPLPRKNKEIKGLKGQIYTGTKHPRPTFMES